MQCRKLVLIFSPSDCGSNYKKAMEIHKHIGASDALLAVENSLQFYRMGKSDVRELFELAPYYYV